MSQAVDLRHMEHARKGGKIYIAAEDWNFAWTPAVLIMDLEERGSS